MHAAFLGVRRRIPVTATGYLTRSEVITTQSLAAVKAHFSHVIDEIASTHERVTVPKNGSPIAVILAVEDYESLMETLGILSDSQARSEVRQADFLYRQLAADPHRVGKPRRFGLEGYRSARRGQYRVICSIQLDEVLVRVVRTSHRADAYG